MHQQHSTLISTSDSKKYTVIRELGEGSFGSVYLVQDQKGKKFALKKIQADPFTVEQSLKQIEVMKKLYHHNLIKIHGFSHDNEQQTIEIIMQYCQEGDLFHYFKRKNKNIAIKDILKIFKQIVQAFVAMNIKGIFHRDLKPENILLTKGLIIKIADFGCARSISTYDMSKIDNFSLDKGTAIYASPEQLMNEKYSAKCDVWSAGVLLYFIYFGNHPFMDQKAHNTLALIRQKTQNKQIQIPIDSDPVIAKIIHLTLIFQDRERASWRELWLSRLFAQKLDNVPAYVKYLHELSKISNYMTKQFWKYRKFYEISNKKDQVFIYFFIKFQWTSMLQGKLINKKDQNFQYLFESSVWQSYSPQQKFRVQIKAGFLDRQKFFNTVKKTLQSKQIYAEIKRKQTKRTSAFCDLDYTLKYAYRILNQIKDQFTSLRQKNIEINYEIWTLMAKWINFERWFDYDKQPTLEKLLAQNKTIISSNPQKFINDELERYESGDLA